VAELQGVEKDVNIVVGTLSKALGGIGGFVCGTRDFIDYLVNMGRAFIYTTAPPPAACAAAEAAMDIIESEPQRRQKLLAMAADLRQAWLQRGYNIAGSQSPIVPLVVGEAERAVRLADALLERGFLAPAIRPPTVPKGKSRIRVSLCAEHEPSDVLAFANEVDACLSRL
jgi:7-keto-8-aminopelargonate synthetase-like enzyme